MSKFVSYAQFQQTKERYDVILELKFTAKYK